MGRWPSLTRAALRGPRASALRGLGPRLLAWQGSGAGGLGARRGVGRLALRLVVLRNLASRLSAALVPALGDPRGRLLAAQTEREPRGNHHRRNQPGEDG